MSRLFWRLYLTVLACLVLFALLVGLSVKILADPDDGDQRDRVIEQLVSDAIPPDLAGEEITTVLNRWRQRTDLDMALYAADGSLVALAGEPFPAPGKNRIADVLRDGRDWQRLDEQWIIYLPLEGNRVLASLSRKNRRNWAGPPFAAVLIVLGLIGLAVAIVAYPSARRITRRLESLQTSVDAFGSGDLTARASIKGKDDIARLAEHFNRSADRIADLLRAQKSLLANASHELRSPLARIRMAVTLFNEPDLPAEQRHQASAELMRNVTELDELVDEVLTASRLDARQAGASAEHAEPAWEVFDLGGLVAEECARLQIEPEVASIDCRGDRKLLRRLVRNLLENALRYGTAVEEGGTKTAGIQVNLMSSGSTDGIMLAVCDRGPGIPIDEAERIFEPFYRVKGASEKAGGVGLGLSLVRQIAQHHQGTVRCEPRNGGGTCFKVTLPPATA
ncbi:MAG: sensor histidine kinase [Burkholderiaceae bacterium]